MKKQPLTRKTFAKIHSAAEMPDLLDIQIRSFKGPSTMAKAKTLSLEYFRIFWKSPPFMPPKVMPARAAQCRA